MGKAVPSSGMLAALALVMLVSSGTEGYQMSRCGFKSRLETVFEQLNLAIENNVFAKLVCTVGNISSFDTSLVQSWPPLILSPFNQIGHRFTTNVPSTQKVNGDALEDLYPNKAVVTTNMFRSPGTDGEDGEISLIPSQVTWELSIPPEVIDEDFIPAGRNGQTEYKRADASTQEKNPSRENPMDQEDRQSKKQKEKEPQKVKVSNEKGSGEQPKEKPGKTSGDRSGLSSKEKLSGELPHFGVGEGQDDQTRKPEEPNTTPQYSIDKSFKPDFDHTDLSGNQVSTEGYPIDETSSPDFDHIDGSGDQPSTEGYLINKRSNHNIDIREASGDEPEITETGTPTPMYAIDGTSDPDFDHGDLSGDQLFTEGYAIDGTSDPDFDHGDLSGDQVFTVGYPIDGTSAPDFDRGDGSGDQAFTEGYAIDGTSAPDFDHGDGSGDHVFTTRVDTSAPDFDRQEILKHSLKGMPSMELLLLILIMEMDQVIKHSSASKELLLDFDRGERIG
ncbi:hypothetical protein NFI96_003100 [Prochilodus magdalenae]|nr:hypothetical protein NFI96_003100 [Prochilodus magdalenae]